MHPPQARVRVPSLLCWVVSHLSPLKLCPADRWRLPEEVSLVDSGCDTRTHIHERHLHRHVSFDEDEAQLLPVKVREFSVGEWS